MSTTRSFQAMLNEYLPNKLLMEEIDKRCWFFENLEKTQDWYGGQLIVPFEGQCATSIAMGRLTAENDVSEDDFVRGAITDYTECWGTMKFHHRDLIDHSGKVTETSFLKIIPNRIEKFMKTIKTTVSIQLGTGPQYGTFQADGTAAGAIVVDRIDRYQIDQKLVIRGDAAPALVVYVIGIDVNGDTITVAASRGGAATDVSAYTTADNALLFTDGADTSSFISMRSVLLSQANGGSATVHGVSKLAYPFLQAVNVDGSGYTQATILDDLFDAYVDVRRRARAGMADCLLMSYQNFAYVLKQLQVQGNLQGNYMLKEGSKKASLYGWDEVEIMSVSRTGSLKIVAIQEWDDDFIAILDKKAWHFRSNGMFRKRKDPENENEYFTVRGTTGYFYLLDVSLFGELEATEPGKNGCIHSIPTPMPA